MLTIIKIKHKNLQPFYTLEIFWISTIHCPICNVPDGAVSTFWLLYNKIAKYKKGYELHSLMGA